MLENLFTAAIAISLIIIYILVNKPAVSRIFFGAFKRDASRKRSKFYMDLFLEHKQSKFSRNMVVQILPWLGVLALVFVLSNQYFLFAMVISGSMEPTFQKGDLVLVQRIDLKPKVGDIVMFPMYGFAEPITHRIVGITEKGDVITKGDANKYPDSTGFPPEQIAGKAVLIGNSPIVLKGKGYYIRPENIGEYTIITSKLPPSFVIAKAFNQFRALQPLIIFFATVFYFFLLLESRMERNRRFGRNGAVKKSP